MGFEEGDVAGEVRNATLVSENTFLLFRALGFSDSVSLLSSTLDVVP